MDTTKYKQGLGKYKTYKGKWKGAPLRLSLADDMTDGALDLMEWLRFLRRAKQEKYQVAESFFDFMTEPQLISVADSALDAWFESMAAKVTENKERLKGQLMKREAAVREAQRTPQPSPRLSPSMMSGPNALSKGHQAMAKKMFNRIDANKSHSLDKEEILVLFPPRRGAQIQECLDTSKDNIIGVDEWNRYLRTYKRNAYTDAITSNPADEESALAEADSALDDLFHEMEEGLQSDDAKRLRSIIKQREIEMDEDKALAANPLGGMKVKPSPAARFAMAEKVRSAMGVTNTRYTPSKTLVYQPGAQREFTERGSDFYVSSHNWEQNSRKNIADAMAEDAESTMLTSKSSALRVDARKEAHKVYNDTTNMLIERAKDSSNANKKIEEALQGTDEYKRALEAARAAVADMFELDAEALEEVSFCKEQRATRPVGERVKDMVSLALKRRTEELDIESHEEMLALINDTQNQLHNVQMHLSAHLGSKTVAADIDMECAFIAPDVDPAERVEKSEEDGNVSGDANVWVAAKKIPNSNSGLFAAFTKYAKAFPLRGTDLPKFPTFAEIDRNNAYIDGTEFSRFINDYGYTQMLDTTQIAEIFQKYARGEDGQAGSLHFEEFKCVVKKIKEVHSTEKKAWGNKVPEPTPFVPARKTALTMEELVFEGTMKKMLPKRPHLHEKAYVPINQPLMWKKEVRDLIDSVKGQETEANRIVKKAKKFVEKRRFEDEMGRKNLLSALHKKQNATSDLLSKLNKEKQIAYQNYEKDLAEQEEVERRIAAVEDYLGVAVVRLQKRSQRPSSERGRDPAEWALDEEVRELRWELHELGNTHKKLAASINKLGKLILNLDNDCKDKELAMDLDQKCVEKIQARLLEVGNTPADEGAYDQDEDSEMAELGYN